MKTQDEMSLFHRQSMLNGNNLRNREKDGREKRERKKKCLF